VSVVPLRDPELVKLDKEVERTREVLKRASADHTAGTAAGRFGMTRSRPRWPNEKPRSRFAAVYRPSR
jgi:hypothetical protein